jgi:hypothetical protein
MVEKRPNSAHEAEQTAARGPNKVGMRPNIALHLGWFVGWQTFYGGSKHTAWGQNLVSQMYLCKTCHEIVLKNPL